MLTVGFVNDIIAGLVVVNWLMTETKDFREFALGCISGRFMEQGRLRLTFRNGRPRLALKGLIL